MATTSSTTGTLSSAGIGSGLDVQGIVDKLMTVESQPLTDLNTRETAIQTQVSAYGALKSGLSALQAAVHALSTPATFRSTTASVGDKTVATATSGDSVVPGNYSLEVTQLAQSQKLVSSGFASIADTVGSGTLTFTFGSTSGGVFTPNATAGAKTVAIPTGQSSLAGIRDAVNAAGIGVTATIVNDGSATGQRLVFTSNSTGAANGLQITVADADGNNTDASGLSQLAYDPAAAVGAGRNLTQNVAAQDALLTVDGIAIQSASNTVTGAIGGVTLTLAKTNAGTPTTVSVARNATAAAGSVGAFVKAYNDLQTTITNLTKYDATKQQASVLTGDATVRLVQTQLRSLVGGSLGGTGTLTTLAQVGITTGGDGQLQFDTDKFNTAFGNDAAAVERLFSATGSASDSLITYGSAGSKTVTGTYPVAVTQLATHGTLTGSGAAGLTITAGVNDSLTAVVDGATVSVTLAAGTYASADALAAAVASKLNGALGGSSPLSVAAASGVLTFTSSRYGSASSVTLSGNAAATLVGAAPTGTAGLDAAGTIGGVPAVASGQTLVGAPGSPAEGLTLSVVGGSTGARGTVSFSQGVGYRLDQVLTGLLASDGTLQARTDGLQSTIKDIDKRKDALQTRLDAVRAAYLKQYNALDTQLAQMQSMSTYLTQQLANLPKISGSSSN